MLPIISVVGESGAGKTTLIEKLIRELKKRAYRIGTVKHASHGFEIDKKEKDSWRHKQAGADTVVISSGQRIAMVKDENCESLACLEKYFQDMDLVITEGYKKENKPKIVIFRSPKHEEPLFREGENLIAFVTNSEFIHELPVFGLDEIEKLADLIEEKYL